MKAIKRVGTLYEYGTEYRIYSVFGELDIYIGGGFPWIHIHKGIRYLGTKYEANLKRRKKQ